MGSEAVGSIVVWVSDGKYGGVARRRGSDRATPLTLNLPIATLFPTEVSKGYQGINFL